MKSIKKLRNIFNYDRIGNCLKLRIVWSKISIRLPFKKKNYFISLGCNCFIRMMFTKYGIKPRKRDGELTCPFDLVFSPHKSVAELLENNFEDIRDNIVYNSEVGFWENKKYSMLYPHYKNLTLEEFKEKISRHVDNFKKLTKNSSDLRYFVTCYNNEFSVDVLNRIYRALLKQREGKHFELYVFNFVDVHSPVNSNISSLNENIIYKEYKLTNYRDFYEKWHYPKYSNPPLLKKIFNDIK